MAEENSNLLNISSNNWLQGFLSTIHGLKWYNSINALGLPSLSKLADITPSQLTNLGVPSKIVTQIIFLAAQQLAVQSNQSINSIDPSLLSVQNLNAATQIDPNIVNDVANNTIPILTPDNNITAAPYTIFTAAYD